MSKKILRPLLSIAAIGLQFVPGLGTIAALGLKIGVGALAGIALGVGSALLLRPKVPRVSPNATDRLTVTLDPGARRKIAFGHTALATDNRYQGYTGTDQEYVEWIVAVASHTCEAIEEIWFDSTKAWSASGGVTSTYSGYLTVETRNPGTSGNGISIDSVWTSTCTLTGCAYVHLRFKVTGNSKKAESPFSSAIPTRVTIRGKGALLPDLREDGVDPDDQTTWDWFSDDSGRNPAWQLLFYLLGWRINGKLAVGRGIRSDRIDLDSFITAANLCDEPVTKAGGGTEPRYRSDALFSEDDDPSLVIGCLCDAMNAVIRDSGGKIGVYVRHNDLATPVCAFTEADIIGDDEWQQTPPIDQTVNITRGRFVDASDAGLYQLVDYPEVSIDSVDGIDRIDPFDLPCVQSASQAQRLAKQRLQRSQYRGVFQAKFNYRAWQVNLGDVVTLSHSALGWEDKLFRVAGTSIGLNGVVDLILKEENEAIYAWDAEEAAPVTPAAPTAYDPTKSAFNQALDDIELTPGPQGDPGPPGADANGLIVTGDRSQITYDGSGSLSPSTQTTTLTAQGSNLPAFGTGASAIVWTVRRADGTPINPSHLADASEIGAGYSHYGAWSHRLDNWTDSVGTLTVVAAATQPSVPLPFWDVSDTDTATASFRRITRTGILTANSATYAVTCYVAKTTGKTTRCRLFFNFTGGTALAYSVLFNSTTGVLVDGATQGTATGIDVQDCGDCWRIGFLASNNGTNTGYDMRFYPAASGLTGGTDVTKTGTETVTGFQVHDSSALFVGYAETGNITGAPWSVMRSPVVSISAANFDSDRGTTNGLTITAAASVAPNGSTPGRLVYGSWPLTKSQDGADGLSVAELTIYQRSGSTPSTPTGGSYDFATKTLTPPSGWSTSRTTGSNPLYESRGTAAIAGTSGTAEPTWAGVAASAQDGQATNVVYTRSETQPSTPSPSSGVPTGCYDDPGSVPDGPGLIWAFFGTRPTPSANWTWQTAKRVEGQDGISPVLVDLDPGTSIVIACNADGSVKSGQLPVDFAVTARQGIAIDIDDITIDSSAGCTTSVSGDVISITAISADTGGFNATISAGDQEVPVAASFTTARDGGAGGGTSASDTSGTNVTSGTYAAIGNEITINASATGKLKLNLTGSYKVANVTGKTITLQTKIQIKPAAGSYSDVSGTEKTGTESAVVVINETTGQTKATNGGVNGSGPYTVTGLSAGASYVIRRMARKSSGTADATDSCFLTLTAEQVS
ncbi:hypothetical protein GCM10023232_27330 [Sphingosinicella ginsenosidimutans]|uniref:Tip attachment protein J domain-containing protein n=1 Tax=Allosphingosinicella ginsenosidimutans TaxID=1176539 RepID=A0A5C6TTR6_9SPHN|nr:phage tail protein [Sphingosinicella ginsenosidimutans]TXC63666.1 hypothetical protein FRZ32_08345 [Sphingosinicella ginsenosidimutans]